MTDLDKIVLLSVKKSNDTIEDSILGGEAVFLDFFLKIFRDGVTKEILDTISQVLEKNLVHVRAENYKKENFERFFAEWLAVNYCHRYNFSNLYIRGFSCSDLTNKEGYYKVRKYVKDVAARYFDELEFDLEEFLHVYSGLLVHLLSPTTLPYEMKNIAKHLITEEDPELVELLGMTMIAVKKSNWAKDGLIQIVRQLTTETEIRRDRANYFEEFLVG